MLTVQIDGRDYVPADQATGSIGIAITTHNRGAQLGKTLEHQLEHLPAGAYVVVVDDGSSTPAKVPAGVDLFRFATSQGIVSAKNKSLALLLDAGCDHLFLWDDDAYPITDGWEAPYVASPEHHLAYQFEDLSGPKKLNDIAKVYEDDEYVAFTGQRGVMLYYTRQAIETVGGFDPIYGRGMYEHIDLAMRIHEAGLTTFKYMDAQGSSELIYSLDEHLEVQRSVPQADREEQVRKNASIFNTRRDKRSAPGFVRFRDSRNVVLTSLLTSAKDPQRGTHWVADYKDLRKLHESVKTGELVLFHDAEVRGVPGSVKGKAVPVAPSSTGNPYFLRWVHAYRYLRDNPDIDIAVCCDANDVAFLQDPFVFVDTLPSDRLVVGDEHEVVDNKWIVSNHRWSKLDDFFDKYGDEQLLNMGFVAGRREVVMEFLHHVITEWEDYQFDLFNKRRGAGLMIGDMAIGNMVLYSRFAGRVVHGPRVNTGFKRNETNSFSLIKHK